MAKYSLNGVVVVDSCADCTEKKKVHRQIYFCNKYKKSFLLEGKNREKTEKFHRGYFPAFCNLSEFVG